MTRARDLASQADLSFDGLTVDTNTLHVDSSNNRVGIGTTSPATKLHIYSSIPDIRLEDTNTNALAELRGNTGTGSFVIATDVNNAISNSKIIFEVDNDEKVRIDNNGNLGIGTNNPSQNLHVSSADHTRVLITGGTDKYAEIHWENDAQKFGMGVQNDNKFFLYNSTGGSQVLTVDTSSNVGINTQSPGSRKLKIVGSSSAYPLALDSTDTDYALEFQKNGVSEWWLKASASNFKIHENGVGDHLSVATGGAITGSSSITATTTINVGTGGGFYLKQDSSESTIRSESQPIVLQTFASGEWQDRVTIANDGDVGIGTSSIAGATKLDVRFSGRQGVNIGSTDGAGAYLVLDGAANGDSSGSDYAYIEHNSSGNLAINVGNSSNSVATRMLIEAGGNVGIGDTNPSKKLAVNGTASIVAGFNDPGLTITGGTTLQNAGKVRLQGAGTECDHIQIVNDGNSMVIGVERSAGAAIMGNTYSYGSVIGSVTNNALHFGINNTTRMRLETSGSLFYPEIGNQGDLTFPICSVSNAGTGNQYMHVQFQASGGDMLHIHFFGYDYGGRYRSGGAGGYIYNTAGQASLYSGVVNGHCVAVYQNIQNRVELVIDTGGGSTTNKWGSYVFFGGTDTITNNSPLSLVQYAWNSSTARLY